MFLPLSADGPSQRFPFVTAVVVLLNIAVLVVQMVLPEAEGVRLLYAAGAIPFEIAHFTDVVEGSLQTPSLVPLPFTVLTAMFLHGGVEHLAGNAWFLWVFGRRVETAMGSFRFLGFYLLVGVLAAAAQVSMTPSSRVPMVGASGAIAGVLGAYLLLWPRSRVQVLLFLLVIVQVVTVPAFAALGVWFAWQVLSGTGDSSVATWAHLGGFLVGAASCRLLWRGPAAASVLPVPRKPVLPWKPSPAPESSSSPL